MTAYDEDLNENTFFVQLRCNYWTVLQEAISSGCIICVPCQRSVKDVELHEDYFLSNILRSVASSSREFVSLSGRAVLRDGDAIHVTSTAEGQTRIKASILFHEEYHGEDGLNYHVWCVSRSLHDAGEEKSGEEDDLSSPATLHDCLKFLRTNVSAKTLAKIDYNVHKVLKTIGDAPSAPEISFKMESVYKEAVSSLVDHFSLATIGLAVESYILRDSYKSVINALRRAKAHDDANFNRLRRMLLLHRNLTEKFHVREEFRNLLPKIRRELDKVPYFHTPIEKLEALARTMKIVANHALNNGFVTTTDDFLPVLVCALAESNWASWHAELAFLQNFRFCRINDCDEKAYFVASLEAGMEHLRSVRPASDWLSPSFDDPTHESYKSNAVKLWEAVVANDVTLVDAISREMRKSCANLGKRLCHPLCTCLECVEVKRLEVDVVGGLLNCPDDGGRTMLHAAACSGHARMIEHLISRGARVDAQDARDQRTPLHVAAVSGHTDAVLLLLYAGADANLKDSHGCTPLHLASAWGHKNCVNALLYFAAHSGLDLNAGDTNGDTPLHLAASWGFGDVVAALLEHKANKSKKNRRGESPVDVAANSVVSDVFKQTFSVDLFENGRNGSYMFSPKMNSKWAVLFAKKRVENRLPDPVDPRVEKCFRAISLGDIRLACYYLGIDPVASSSPSLRRNKCHPLCKCDVCANEAEAEVLDVNCSNSDGYTPLHMAALHNRAEIVKALLVNDADPNKTNARGMTPLHLACQCNLVDVAKILLAFQADLSVRDEAGNSALHYACILGNVELARILLAFGAADAGVNTNKRTPSMEAKERRFSDVMRLFSSP